MNYDTFLYIRPPRAESAMEAKYLSTLDENNYFAQPKYNGSCCALFLEGRKSYKLFNRHGEDLTLQRPMNYCALNDSAEKWMVLCGEYMNKNKLGEDNKPFNHKFIIWDILVHQGKYLLGTTVESRLSLLHQLFGTARGTVTAKSFTLYDHLIVTEHENIFLAPTYTGGFKKLYDEIIPTDAYEGLVLKRRNGKLSMGNREKNNTEWQVKIRKPTKNYHF